MWIDLWVIESRMREVHSICSFHGQKKSSSVMQELWSMMRPLENFIYEHEEATRASFQERVIEMLLDPTKGTNAIATGNEIME